MICIGHFSVSDYWKVSFFLALYLINRIDKLLHVKVCVDINSQSVSLSETNLQFQCDSKSKIFVKEGSATELSFIKDSKTDFICTHPPYANIIKYSKDIEGDISLLGADSFLSEMKKVAAESYRVLKKGKMCAVMIGDFHQKR